MRTGEIMAVKNLAPIRNMGGAQKYLMYRAFFNLFFQGYLVSFFFFFLFLIAV